MRRAFLCSAFGFLLSAFCLCFALSSIDHENNPQFDEAYRIKVWNSPGGTIEVSSDKGKTWEYQGKVIYPTQKTNPEGYTASRWVGDGKVAATAVNAIHIKTATEPVNGGGVIFSLIPRELLQRPSAYRSYYSPNSSIYTDIPAGTSIFGGGFAPYVGNVALVSQLAKQVIPLPKDYVPAIGDKIYIIIDKPVDYPKEIDFENRLGGQVTIKYFSGVEKVIAQVIQPVAGVGRFEGTKYASAGRIRANHAGVIDVSTSPLGHIGGFQIVPSQHSANMKFSAGSPQWLVIGPVATDEAIEGQAPLFSSFIRPNYSEADLESANWDQKLLDRFLVEAKLKGNDKWQPLPVKEFADYDLVGGISRSANSALTNVTAIRILFPIRQ